MTTNDRSTALRRTRPIWLGEGLSEVGSQVTLIAAPLLAVTQLSASAAQVALLQTAFFIAVVLAGLVAGAVIDRSATYWLLLSSNLARALLVAAVPVAATLGELTFALLLTLFFVAACVKVFNDLAVQAGVVRIAQNELLVVNARLASIRSLATTIGPGLAGISIGALGAASAHYVDASTFLIAALLLLVLGRDTLKQAKPEPVQGEPIRSAPLGRLRDAAAGFGIIRRNPVLRHLVLVTALLNLFYGGFYGLQILFLAKTLAMSSAEIGALLALEGAAAVATAAASGRLLTLKLSTILVTTLLGLSAGIAAFAATPAQDTREVIRIAVAAVAVITISVTTTVFNVAVGTARQQATPKAYLGRVGAAAQIGFLSSLPVGAVAAGLLAEGFGARAVLASVSVGVAVVAAYACLRAPGAAQAPSSSTEPEPSPARA